MKYYTIGEIAKLLGIKQHIIRYWEKEFSLLQTKRNLAGRRLYSLRELDYLFRMAYLCKIKGYSVAKACQKIWEEAKIEPSAEKIKIRQLRAEVLDIMEKIKKKIFTKKKADNIKR